MSRKFRISEEQYNKLMAEDVTLTADVAATNGDVKQAVDNTKREAQKNGVDLNKANIEIPASDNNLSESNNILITKKTLVENRLKVLKENSILYTFKDFIKN